MQWFRVSGHCILVTSLGHNVKFGNMKNLERAERRRRNLCCYFVEDSFDKACLSGNFEMTAKCSLIHQKTTKPFSSIKIFQDQVLFRFDGFVPATICFLHCHAPPSSCKRQVLQNAIPSIFTKKCPKTPYPKHWDRQQMLPSRYLQIPILQYTPAIHHLRQKR